MFTGSLSDRHVTQIILRCYKTMCYTSQITWKCICSWSFGGVTVLCPVWSSSVHWLTTSRPDVLHDSAIIYGDRKPDFQNKVKQQFKMKTRRFLHFLLVCCVSCRTNVSPNTFCLDLLCTVDCLLTPPCITPWQLSFFVKVDLTHGYSTCLQY